MKLNIKINGIAQKILSSVFFLGSFLFLQYLYAQTLYIPFYMASMIIILPVVVNFLLHFFACKFNVTEPKKKEDGEEKSKGVKKFLGALGFTIKRAMYKLTVLYNKANKILQIIAVLIAFAVVQILFGMAIFSYTSQYRNLDSTTQFIYPIILAVLFVGSIIIDKWIKHSKVNDEKTEAFFHNSRVLFYIYNLCVILLTVAITLRILNIYDIQRYLYYVLIVVFYYASVFILISLLVSFLKKEILKKPKIIILLPFAGKDKNDLSVLGFLENNTGITMRGLWSMKLIKQIVPYTIISVAALFWISTGVVQVEANQEAVVYRLGVLQEETLKPGLHFTLPAPFDTVEYYNKETVRQVVIGYKPKEISDNLWTEPHGSQEYKLLLGQGNELVSVNLRVEYKIDDLYQYLTVNNSPDSLVSSYAYNLVMQKTIKTDLETLLSIDREAFSTNFKADLVKIFDEKNVGIKIENVFVESIHPPLEVADVYQALKSTEIEKESILYNAEIEKNNILVGAQMEYDSAISQANIDKYDAITEATSSVSEFMASVAANESNPKAYYYYKYLDALTEAYGKNNLVLVGDGVDSSKIYFGNFGGGSIINSGSTSSTDNENT